MSDTPRTDAAYAQWDTVEDGRDFADILERELAAAQKRIAELDQLYEGYVDTVAKQQSRIAELESNQCEAEPVRWISENGNVFSRDQFTGGIPLYRKAKV